MLQDEVEFVDRDYGKDFVRLLSVKRHGLKHDCKEIEVSTRLTLHSKDDFIHGDNSDIIATDSQKNTVYILAKRNGVSNCLFFSVHAILLAVLPESVAMLVLKIMRSLPQIFVSFLTEMQDI